MNISLTLLMVLSLKTANATSDISIEFVNLINSIYFGIKAQTLVVFHYSSTRELYNMEDVIWNKLEQPKILLTLQNADEELRTKFNSHILALIVMDDSAWSQRQWQHLEIVINRWSNTDVVFLTNNNMTMGVESAEHFLRQCWLKGLTKILLTSFVEPFVVYTIQPFPQIALKTTSVSLYLKERGRFLDGYGYHVRVSAGNNPPRALVYYNKDGDIVYSGYISRLIQIFAQSFNLTIDWVLMPNFTENYALRDCVKYLLNHQIDMCGDSLPLNEKAYAIATPLFISKTLIIVPFAQPISAYKYFLRPFESNLWALIIVTLSYMTIVLSLINRLQLGFWEAGVFFLKSLQSFLYLPCRLPRWGAMQKFLMYAILTLTGFIISNLYMAFLSSILTTNVYESQIETLDDLKQRKITILINDMDQEVLSLYNSFEAFSDNYVHLDIPDYQRIRNSLDPRYAYVNMDDKADFFLYQQKYLQRPLLYKVSHPLSGIYGCIPMQVNWPFAVMFNHYILTMFDTGIIKHLEEQTREEGIAMGIIQFLKTTYLDIHPLSISYFQMPALLLAGGYLSSILCFVLENVLYIFKNKPTRIK